MILLRLLITAAPWAIGAAVIGVFVLYIQSSELAKIETEIQQREVQTLERINEAISDTRTPSDIRERLRRLADD